MLVFTKGPARHCSKEKRCDCVCSYGEARNRGGFHPAFYITVSRLFCQDCLEGVQKASRRELLLQEQYPPEEATRRSVVGAAERARSRLCLTKDQRHSKLHVFSNRKPMGG